MQNDQNPATAHHTITTARRPDNICSSILVRGRSIRSMASSGRQPQTQLPRKDSHFRHFGGFFFSYMCIGFDYYVMTPYILYILIIICLCVPAPGGWARCWYNCDYMFKDLCFNIHSCLFFIWIYKYHVQIKPVQFCVHLPLPYAHSFIIFLPVSIPITWKSAHQKMLTPRLFRTHKKNTCKQINKCKVKYIFILTYICMHIQWT